MCQSRILLQTRLQVGSSLGRWLRPTSAISSTGSHRLKGLLLSPNLFRTMASEPPPAKRPRLSSPSEPQHTVVLDDGMADISEQINPSETSSQHPAKQNASSKKGAKKRKNRKPAMPEPYSHDDVLWHDIMAVLGKDVVYKAIEDGVEFDSPHKFHDEVELTIAALTSHGEALAKSPGDKPWSVLVPFALPNEVIRARIYRNGRMHSQADLLEVLKPNSDLRDNSRIGCKYFGTCAGCQYQMLSYNTQLYLKRNVIVKAFKNFSGLPEDLMPEIGATVGSPLQYGYRTKITPHFDAPPKQWQKAPTPTSSASPPDWLKIGFNKIGTSHVMDIEECPIATQTINDALGPVRRDIQDNIGKYKKGVSLIFRDAIEPPPINADGSAEQTLAPEDKHLCVTDHRATMMERVDDMLFEYTASSFFQNNNSVLPPLTEYVRDAIFEPESSSFAPTTTITKPTHLVDAYCGAGLFAITLSPYFSTIAGIELSAESIRSATRNAELNGIPKEKITFRAGDAKHIFDTVRDFPAQQTALIIDPPRKGSDEGFIDQLVAFMPQTVVYVSCNVHTQARNVGMILRKMEGTGKRYDFESLVGFDLFPQTAHVESVAVLRLVDA